MNDLIVEQIIDGEPRQVEEVAELIKMRKVVVPDNFHYDSIPARCIGLIMYDFIVSPDESCDSIISKFKNSDIFKKTAEEIKNHCRHIRRHLFCECLWHNE